MNVITVIAGFLSQICFASGCFTTELNPLIVQHGESVKHRLPPVMQDLELEGNGLRITVDKRARSFIELDMDKLELTVNAFSLNEEATGVYWVRVLCRGEEGARM